MHSLWHMLPLSHKLYIISNISLTCLNLSPLPPLPALKNFPTPFYLSPASTKKLSSSLLFEKRQKVLAAPFSQGGDTMHLHISKIEQTSPHQDSFNSLSNIYFSEVSSKPWNRFIFVIKSKHPIWQKLKLRTFITLW